MSLRSDYDKKTHDVAIKQIVADLVEEKATAGPNHMNMTESYTQKLLTLGRMGITLSRDALQKRVNREYKNSHHAVKGVEVIVQDDGTDDLSGLTSETGMSSGSESTKLRGRPKGSTDEKKRDDKNKRLECINAISKIYSTETTKRLAGKSKAPRGFLENLIKSKSEEYGISEFISKSTIRSRHRRGVLCASHRGTPSPVASAEMALVKICVQMGKIKMPLTGPQAVTVFNDLIRGTRLQESLSEFQRVRNPESMSLGSCGLTWWKGLKKDTLIR